MAKSLKISKLAVARQTNLLMEIQPLDQLTKIINDALDGTAKLRKSFKTFFVITSILFLSMTKRKNFTQMALSSDCCESRFRQNFRKKEKKEIRNSANLCRKHWEKISFPVFRSQERDFPRTGQFSL